MYWLITCAQFISAQVYNLEKVLKYKKDPSSQTSFLDEAMIVSPSVLLSVVHPNPVFEVLENRPITTFWSALARSLDKHSKEATKGKTLSLLLP
jgi:hypothetical protein